MGRVLLYLAGCGLGILLIGVGIQRFLVPNPTNWQIGVGCFRIACGLIFIYNCGSALIRGAPKGNSVPTT